MEWATTIFPIQSRIERSDFVERIWRTHGVAETEMISVAVPRWQIVVVRDGTGAPSVFVRGPETKASIVPIPEAAEFIGIEFKLGAFLPALVPSSVVDVGQELSAISKTRISLANSTWEIPSFENAADFVTHLVREGELVRDPVVEQALVREAVGITERSVQRRFLRATGLTYGAVRQIERAKSAAALLTGGKSIPDAVEIAGYADQSHMTRSLQRFLGKTPGKLVSGRR